MKPGIYDVYASDDGKYVVVVRPPPVVFTKNGEPVVELTRVHTYYAWTNEHAEEKFRDILNRRWRPWRRVGNLLLLSAALMLHAAMAKGGYLWWAAVELLAGFVLWCVLEGPLRVPGWRGKGFEPPPGWKPADGLQGREG